LLVAALAGAVQAWERLQTRLDHERVKTMKAAWHEQDRQPHDHLLNTTFKLGYKASEKEKSNAEYRFVLAGLHAWRQKSLRSRPEQARAETRKIIENLKAALARRPTWHEPWITLALVKYQSGDVDQEFKVSLEKAVETGKYETVVQRGVSLAGLRAWERLEPELRNRVVETVGIALENPRMREFAVAQIVMTGRYTPFGEHLASDSELRMLVNKYQEEKNGSL